MTSRERDPETDHMGLDVATLFAGERLCLDFINTRCRRRDETLELIGSGAALRRWLRMAEGVAGRPLGPGDAAWDAGYGERVLPRAVALRTALRDLVLSVIDGASAPAAALDAVNALLRENPACPQIESDGAGFREAVAYRRPDDAWLAEIARDAVDLLCRGDLSLLRQCAHPTCVRVFYDTTKNHKRRWCVEKCGSKPRAAAYYRRKVARAGSAAPPADTPTD